LDLVKLNAPLAFVPPVFCNVFCGLVQPLLISRKTDHFHSAKPFRRVGGRIAKRCQLAHSHQNLNITFSEAEQFRRRHDIKAGRQLSSASATKGFQWMRPFHPPVK